MSAKRLMGAVAIVVLAASACGSAPKSVARSANTPSASSARSFPTYAPIDYPTEASSARTQCPAVQLAPQFPPSAPSGRKLALVFLNGNYNNYVVRDLTDINHPFTVSTLSGEATPTNFVSATDLSAVRVTPTWGFERMPLSGSPRTVVVSCALAGGFLAWSPDGTQAAYLVTACGGGEAEFHVIARGTDRQLMSFPSFPWCIGCESLTCADRWFFSLTYSPDGRYISFNESLRGPVLRIWQADGTPVKAIDDNTAGNPDGVPTMSVWSGASFYWRDGHGVEVWHDGTQSLLLPNVDWIRPKASPAGGKIVFETRDAYGVPTVYMLDTTSGATRSIASLRSEPAFLTDRYLWYEEERPCSAQDVYCSGAASPERTGTAPSGRTFIYDLQTGTESESIITRVVDVWPHAA